MDPGGVAAERKYWEGRATALQDPIQLDGYYRGASPLGEDVIEQLATEISEELDLHPGDELLDVGCGAGLFLHHLKGKVRHAWGADLSQGLLKHLRQRGAVPVNVAEAGRLPFRDGVADKVLCYGVFGSLHHRDYARRTMSELVRVCRPGGKILIGNIPYEAEVRALYRAALASRSEIGLLRSCARVAKMFVNRFRPSVAKIHGYSPEFFLQELRPCRPRVQESRTVQHRSYPRFDVIVPVPAMPPLEGEAHVRDVR